MHLVIEVHLLLKIGLVRAAVRVALSLLKYISLKDGVLDVFVYTVNHAILF